MAAMYNLLKNIQIY